MKLTDKGVARFWSKVDVRGEDQCWGWTGTVDKKGYGLLNVSQKILKAHRISAYLSGVNITDLFVCHKCDNPTCVNPNHLFAGSAEDNNRDMASKGRARHGVNPPRGIKHTQAILEEADIPRIRKLSASGLTYKAISLQYGVSPEQISNIVRRKNWSHI